VTFFLFLLLAPSYWVAKFLLDNDSTGREPKKAVREAIIIGLLVLLLAGPANEIIARALGFASSEEALFIDISIQGLSYIFFFALSEELLKFIPMALHIYGKSYFNDVIDGVIYFALAGLAFGVFETFFYGLSYGGTGIVLLRLVFVLFLHAGTTAIAGYSFAKYTFGSHKAWQLAASFMAAVLLHTFYNLFISSGSMLVLIGMAISLFTSSMIFVLYYRATLQAQKANN